MKNNNTKRPRANQQVKKQSTVSKSKRKKTISFNFFWERKKRPGFGAEIFVNVKFVVFIVLSIISAFINLIFIAGLTKSPYILGDTRGWYISIPAALFLGCLSIGLDFSKALHVIQVNTLNSLARHLTGETWVGRVRKVARKWMTVYILYVALSVITSVSLSSISIGSGITRNANLRDQVNEYIAEGEMYSGINKEATKVNMANLIGKATDTSEKDASTFAKNQMLQIRPKVEEYKVERDEFENSGLQVSSKDVIEWRGSEIVPNDYWDKKNREINILLQNAGYGTVSGAQIKNLNLTTVERVIKENYFNNSKTTSTDEATAKLNELTNETDVEARAWLTTLNNLQLLNPKNNEVVVFDVSEDKPANVLAKTAVTQLKALKVDIENDSGDIGISSKIFMQLGGWITNLSSKNEDTSLESILTNSTRSSTFGPTEIMMMLMLLFLSLLCELGINQFSPEVSISRKMLGQFRRYFDKDFDVNKFMLGISIDLNDYDLISDEDLDNEVEHVKNKIRRKAEIAALLKGEVIEDSEKEKQSEDLQKHLEDLKQVYATQLQLEKERLQKEYESKTVQTKIGSDVVSQTKIEENPKIEITKPIQNSTIETKVDLPPKVEETPISERIEELQSQVKEAEQHSENLSQAILQTDYKPGTIGYSETVDQAIHEIDNLLLGE